MTKGLRLLALSSMPLVFAAVASGAVKFTSTWSSPDAPSISFKGKKVAALIISDDVSLRMSGEEALARELTARQMQGVTAFRLIPQEELKNTERAKAWFERGGIEGVVALRPVSMTKEKRYPVEIWSTPTYSTLWGYYPYSWGAVYNVGSNKSDTLIVVESLIFNVATGKLVWGGVSEAKNPKSMQSLISDIVKEASIKIDKQFR